jgi:hypothetical protein
MPFRFRRSIKIAPGVRGAHVSAMRTGASLMASAMLSVPAASIAAWSMSRNDNKMDQTTKVFITTVGSEKFPGGIGRQDLPSLALRCEKGKAEMILAADVILGNNTGELHVHAVRLRFDDGKPERVLGSEATNGTSVFLPNARALAKRILKSKTLLVEVTPFRNAPATTTFDVRGLSLYSKEMASDCGIK